MDAGWNGVAAAGLKSVAAEDEGAKTGDSQRKRHPNRGIDRFNAPAAEDAAIKRIGPRLTAARGPEQLLDGPATAAATAEPATGEPALPHGLGSQVAGGEDEVSAENGQRTERDP